MLGNFLDGILWEKKRPETPALCFGHLKMIRWELSTRIVPFSVFCRFLWTTIGMDSQDAFNAPEPTPIIGLIPGKLGLFHKLNYRSGTTSVFPEVNTGGGRILVSKFFLRSERTQYSAVNRVNFHRADGSLSTHCRCGASSANFAAFPVLDRRQIVRVCQNRKQLVYPGSLSSTEFGFDHLGYTAFHTILGDIGGDTQRLRIRPRARIQDCGSLSMLRSARGGGRR